jgi:MFS family permease
VSPSNANRKLQHYLENGGVSSNNTIGFWVPTIIQGLGVKSTLTIGILSTVPYIGALIGMVLVSRHSDRTLERRYHAALPCLACAVGLIGIGWFANSPVLAFTALVLVTAWFYDRRTTKVSLDEVEQILI